MIFSLKYQFFWEPHIHTGLLNKKHAKQIKNIEDMAKSSLIQKIQKLKSSTEQCTIFIIF